MRDIPTVHAKLLTAMAPIMLFWLASYSTAAYGQHPTMPPIGTPFPTPDFHFSDPARDSAYWRLEGEAQRMMAVFRESLFAARRALRMPVPPPGSPAWQRTREAVERAIHDGRTAHNALDDLIWFVTRERSRLSPAEAEYADDVRRVNEESLRATSDNLVDLLASLVGIRVAP